GIGCDLEQRGRGDRVAGAGHRLPDSTRVDDLAIFDHPHGEPREVVTLHQGIDLPVELYRGGGEDVATSERSCQREHHLDATDESRAHAPAPAAMRSTSAHTRSRLPPQSLS